MSLTRKEFSKLKVQALMEEAADNSGLTLAQMQQIDKLNAKAARAKAKELNISVPEPIATAGIKKAQENISGGIYIGRRSIAGKGIGQTAIVKLTVFTSVAIESDDRLWFHASLTRGDKKMPTYEDLCWLKTHFFPHTWAIQVFPI